MKMRRTRYGLGSFGKGFIAPPPSPLPVNVTVTGTPGTPGVDSSADIADLRAQIEALKAQRNDFVAQGSLVMPGAPTQGGAVVEGASGKTQRELLTTPGQDFFTRTTDHAENIRWDDWRRLAPLLPAGFNEQAYLARHADVADAVKKGAMPSGAWHYVMYGMPNCQAGAAGKACESRALSGWRGLGNYRRKRRPGYLSGIFSNWNARD